MKKWGRCVHGIFLSIYNKVGLLLYAVNYIIEICHMLIEETILYPYTMVVITLLGIYQ